MSSAVRVAFVVFLAAASLAQCLAAKRASDLPPALTLSREKLPKWVREQGIVMAGDWEPLLYRTRLASGRFEPTPEERALYDSEHTSEMLRIYKTRASVYSASGQKQRLRIADAEPDLQAWLREVLGR